MRDTLILLVAVSIILFSVFALWDIPISEAVFTSGFLRRTSKNDERIVTRGAKWDERMIDLGRERGSQSALYVLTSAMILEKQTPQISQHIRVVSPLFSKVFLRVITIPGQQPPLWDLPENVEVDIREMDAGYGGDSKSSFRQYVRQWEEHHSLLPPSRSAYLLRLDTENVGRIFPRGILESIGYLESHKGISGIGFRTVVPGRGGMYPTRGEGKFLPERVPLARGLVDHPDWDSGIYRIPFAETGKRLLNSQMVYIIKPN